MRAVDVTATVGADGVEIKLPRLRVVVEQRQAERRRDVLNTVLPERHPRPTDVEILQAARSILEERGQDAESIGHVLWEMEQAGVPMEAEPRPPTLHLLSIAGDIEPELSGAYEDERERVEAAQDYRRAHGPEDGLYRVDVDRYGVVTVDTFSGAELNPPRGCTLCGCTAVGAACGLPVCSYHTDHTEDDPRCPDCLPVHTGDRVRDPRIGEWRTVARIDLAENTAHMADGGCMSIDEAAKYEKRLPSEALS